MGNGPLQLFEQAASGPAAELGELLEVGHWVNSKEVLVGLLVGEVKLADVGLGQDGLEDVVLIWVVHNVLENFMGVSKPAQLAMICLKVMIHH